MTETPLPPSARSTRWTCPFCVLLCDDLSVRENPVGNGFELAAGTCAPAEAGLAQFGTAPSAATPRVDGRPCPLDDAVAAAARALVASRQPLFGGLGTDVAGARALYRLACDTGAICDPADGDALMHGVRALQDRGGFTTTLAEVRNRADLIVCVGGLPFGPRADFFRRCGLGEATVAQRHVVVLGGSANDEAALAALTGRGVTTESVSMQGGDLFSTVALLAAVLADRQVGAVPPQLATLAERLRAARYSVIVAETPRLPEHGALLIETIDRIVATLNLATRSGALWLGGGDGAGTVNQVFTWLSGLPLRSRAGPAGLEHEPLCFDAQRLIDDAAVDSLLWVSCFDAGCVPPPTDLPLIVLGHPGLAAPAGRTGTVFVPVSTPGVGSAGHLFRGDGGAVLPLVPLYRDTLPELADVLVRLTQAVKSLRTEASA